MPDLLAAKLDGNHIILGHLVIVATVKMRVCDSCKPILFPLEYSRQFEPAKTAGFASASSLVDPVALLVNDVEICERHFIVKLYMEILFENRKLQKLCEKEKEANKKLGRPCADKLRNRLAELLAAVSVRDLTVGKPHPLKEDCAGQFALTLKGGKCLVFEPSNEPVPYKDDGSIDWSRVTHICIVFIGDYHD